METEATATTQVSELMATVPSDASVEEQGFGTRPQTGRPHSISLFGPDRSSPRDGGSRGLELLLGVGIGAAAMYYFDPHAGRQRRSLVRDRIVDAVTMAPDTFEAAAQDVGHWARATLESQARKLAQPPHHADAAHWTPASRLVASAVGGALALLAAKRHDALGAVVGVVASALLARGVSAGARRIASGSEVTSEPVGREFGDALERPGLLEQV